MTFVAFVHDSDRRLDMVNLPPAQELPKALATALGGQDHAHVSSFRVGVVVANVTLRGRYGS